MRFGLAVRVRCDRPLDSGWRGVFGRSGSDETVRVYAICSALLNLRRQGSGWGNRIWDCHTPFFGLADSRCGPYRPIPSAPISVISSGTVDASSW
jgi:hypothetical protein